MRNPNRIDFTLEVLSMFWKKRPDMRLMQLFEVIHNEFKKEDLDSFYVEDKDLINKLMEYFDEQECNKILCKALDVAMRTEEK